VPPTPTPAPAPTKVVAPVDTIIYVTQQEPDTLNPDIGAMMAKSLILNFMFPGMATQDNNAAWIPRGVVSLPTIDNGGAKLVGTGADQPVQTTCKIRPGLKWNDDKGTAVTAADVIYTWKYIMDPDAEVEDRTYTEKIYDITSPSPDTYVISFMSENQAHQAADGTLTGNVDFAAFQSDYGPDGNNYGAQSGPVVDPLYYICTGGFEILPSAILGNVAAKDMGAAPFSTAPVGYGPYKFVAWKPAQQIELTAVSDSVFGVPKIKNVIYRVIPDSNSVLAALQKGEVDLVGSTGGLSPDMAPELDKLVASKVWNVTYATGYQWEHIDLNTTAFPFNDLNNRKAVAYGINKQAYLDTLYYGKFKAGTSFLPDFNWAYGGDQLTIYNYDQAKAKAALSDGGWDCTSSPCTRKAADGTTQNFEFTLMTTDRADREKKAQIIQSQLKSLNLGVNLSFLYGRGLFAVCSAGGPLNCMTYQAAIFTWLTSDDPDSPATLYLCKGIPTKDNNWSGQNYSAFCDKTYDADVVKAGTDLNTVLSQDKRKPLYVEAQKIWTAAVPVIPLEQVANILVSRVTMKNFKPAATSVGESWNAWEWELSK
jgi:peptide/nickel transport system substrate-binding protein